MEGLAYDHTMLTPKMIDDGIRVPLMRAIDEPQDDRNDDARNDHCHERLSDPIQSPHASKLSRKIHHSFHSIQVERRNQCRQAGDECQRRAKRKPHAPLCEQPAPQPVAQRCGTSGNPEIG